MQTCEICGNKAVYRYSPDLDIDGLGACRKHKDDVGFAYLLLTTRGKKSYVKFIRQCKVKNYAENNVCQDKAIK